MTMGKTVYAGASQPIRPRALRMFIHDLSRAAGMDRENADRFSDVYLRATLRAVGHHDVHDLPLRIAAFRSGAINPNPSIRRSGGRAALEGYDGDNGAGELCTAFIVERATQLAGEYGIGMCTIRNSNHFLSAAPYVERAAEAGLLAIVLSRSKPVMGMPGYGERLIGNSPIGFATASDKEYPLLLDVCLAYASFGNLEDAAAAGERIPPAWGGDKTGASTTDPTVITTDGVSYPIGEHKGFGLGLLVEILTGGLAGGQVADGRNPDHPGGSGVHSQTAIVIRPDSLMSMAAYRAKVTELIDRVEDRAPGIRMPGRRSYSNRQHAQQQDTITLKDDFIDELNALAQSLDVSPLRRFEHLPLRDQET